VPDTLGRASAGFYPVASLRRDAVPVERRNDQLAVAARRVGPGRVIQVGFDESWRWRIAGGAGSGMAHREWWSRVVSSVAYGAAHPAARPDGAPSAPVAHIFDRLGAPMSAERAAARKWSPDPRLLVALMFLLLLVEWASRRLRGAR